MAKLLDIISSWFRKDSPAGKSGHNWNITPLALYRLLVVAAMMLQVALFYNCQTLVSGKRAAAVMMLTEGSIVYFLAAVLPRRFRWGALLFLLLNLLFLWVNIIYSSYFGDFFPIALVAQAAQLRDVSGFISEAVDWREIVMSLPALIPLVYYIWRRKDIERQPVTVRTTLMRLSAAVFMFLCGQGIGWSLMQLQWPPVNKQYAVRRYFSTEPAVYGYFIKWGITPTYFCSLMPWFDKDELDESDVATLKYLIGDRVEQPDNAFREQLKLNRDKSLILIIVESFSSTTINREIAGRHVMPFLDSLLAGPGVIYFPNIIPQVKRGVSSDGQLLYTTGLYPLTNGVTVSKSRLPRIPTLPLQMKSRGGRTVELICEDPALWNHLKTTKAWGYDTLYSRLMYKDGVKVDYDIVDSLLVNRAIELLKTDGMPSMLTLCTLSMHGPFNTVAESYFTPERTGENQKISAFYEMTSRFDRQLERFIKFLHESGMYDDALIVIASDHDPHAFRERPLRSAIPLIILNSGINVKSTDIAGQIDVFPTILDALGRYDDAPWTGFGRSLLRERKQVAGYTRSRDWICHQLPADTAEIRRIRRTRKLSIKLLQTNWLFENELFPSAVDSATARP